MSTMSPAVVQDEGVLCMMKNTTIDAIKWCGRVMSDGWEGFKDIVFKTVEYARPFFNDVGNFLVNGFTQAKDWAIANKSSIGLVAAGMVIAVAGIFIFGALVNGGEASQQQQQAN